MFNSPLPSANELPSSRQLIRSTAIAFAAAMGLLVTVVMPSEYAVDPTGLGRAMGLTQMGEIKISLAQEALADEAATKAAVPAPAIPAPVPEAAPAPAPQVAAVQPAQQAVQPAAKTDEVSLTLKPGEGREIKLEMRKELSLHMSGMLRDRSTTTPTVKPMTRPRATSTATARVVRCKATRVS